jgi:uncharacterized membrane protein
MDKEVPVSALSKLTHPLITHRKTLGQKAADALTKWAGSWFFIITFGIFLLLWMALNTYWIFFSERWDPYPFILLNLVLSCLAAVQAPIILMSQNREAQKDRLRAEYDYAVNKRTEKKIIAIQMQLEKIEKKLNKR